MFMLHRGRHSSDWGAHAHMRQWKVDQQAIQQVSPFIYNISKYDGKAAPDWQRRSPVLAGVVGDAVGM